MNEMVGRAAGGHEADHRVNDRFFVDDLRQRPLTAFGQVGQAVHGGAGQRLAKRSTGIDEGGVGNVQPHQLHHHLVGIGGAVEGAGAGRVVRAALRLQQLVLADLPFGVELPDALLFLVRQA